MIFRFCVLLVLSSVFVACDGRKPAAPAAPAAAARQLKAWEFFSGERAMEDVRAIVATGPRPSGSEALVTCRKLISDRLKEAGWEVQEQAFEDYTGLLRGTLKFVNIRARFPVAGTATWQRKVRTLVCSHYDTKWFEGSVFTGANDGGSSCGVVLEIARVTAKVPELAAGLELVFFDGEEAVQSFTNPVSLDDKRYDGLFGSRHYARQLHAAPEEARPEFMVLFDIIGHADLVVDFPINFSPRLVAAAQEEAQSLGWGRQFVASGEAMVDDHVPLSWVGVQVIDYIALESFRTWWHTGGDTIDKVVPDSLEKNGKAGLRLIERITLP